MSPEVSNLGLVSKPTLLRFSYSLCALPDSVTITYNSAVLTLANKAVWSAYSGRFHTLHLNSIPPNPTPSVYLLTLNLF